MTRGKSTVVSQNDFISHKEKKEDGETESMKKEKIIGEPETGEGEARVRWAAQILKVLPTTLLTLSLYWMERLGIWLYKLAGNADLTNQKLIQSG